MDDLHFDRLARLIGASPSRRGLLKTIGGGVLAAIAGAVGRGDASAAAKRSAGNSCRYNSDCASGLCVQESRTRKICHCQSAADCPAVTAQCQTAACLANGYCGSSVTASAACDDGNDCTSGDVCQADGSCVGTAVANGTTCAAGTCQNGTCVAACEPPGGPCTLSNFISVCCHGPNGVGCQFVNGDPNNGNCFTI